MRDHDAEADLRYAAALARLDLSRTFQEESDRIEQIEETAEAHVHALKQFLDLPTMSLFECIRYTGCVQPTAQLRDHRGRDVSIRDRKTGRLIFAPPPGGPHITARLVEILDRVNTGRLKPAEAHVEFESLHPFTDGNGRCGRAIWAWQMEKEGRDPFGLGFLHSFYYESLELVRRLAAS